MGLTSTTEQVEMIRRKMVACGSVQRRMEDEGRMKKSFAALDDEEGSMVCVTSGVSYLGLALVNHLLLRGYSVRITIDNPEDIQKLKEMEDLGDMKTTEHNLEVIIAKINDVDSIQKAFEGCYGVFHTSAFIDPAGLSGYTKSMADIEVRVAEMVMEACARTSSVKKCVFTSSLLACIWQDNTKPGLSHVINHASWSNESYCTDKKLWYALGKMRAEKAAWKIANERGLKLTTICPALITGPEFYPRNSTPTIAYLKGSQWMYYHGLLATVGVVKLAEAHVCVFKAMNTNASGRYICFDHVIGSQREAENLANEIGMPIDKICGNAPNNSVHRFELSKDKLCTLMSRPLKCYSEY
ncbi:hypothetical protein VNO77_20146 [Canavalia gladiata]|uniref:3-beta hydroxysteroid dehydrogenase/isomerase domain-containing protein n=1 Tax=Canavalia gladiata TaxID=3824 RepID=A0AAN9LNS0_CANGL